MDSTITCRHLSPTVLSTQLLFVLVTYPPFKKKKKKSFVDILHNVILLYIFVLKIMSILGILSEIWLFSFGSVSFEILLSFGFVA